MSIEIGNIACLYLQSQVSAVPMDPVSVIEAGGSLDAALSLIDTQKGDSLDAVIAAGNKNSGDLDDSMGLLAAALVGGWEIIDDGGGGG